VSATDPDTVVGNEFGVHRLDEDTGTLYYDPDGPGPAPEVLVGTVISPPDEDFTVAIDAATGEPTILNPAGAPIWEHDPSDPIDDGCENSAGEFHTGATHEAYHHGETVDITMTEVVSGTFQQIATYVALCTGTYRVTGDIWVNGIITADNPMEFYAQMAAITVNGGYVRFGPYTAMGTSSPGVDSPIQVSNWGTHVTHSVDVNAGDVIGLRGFTIVGGGNLVTTKNYMSGRSGFTLHRLR